MADPGQRLPVTRMSTPTAIMATPSTAATIGQAVGVIDSMRLSMDSCPLTPVAVVIAEADDRTRIVYVPSPSNPTGSYNTAEEIDVLVASMRAITV